MARVPDRFEQVVVECSEQCPGECIFVEAEPEPLVRPTPIELPNHFEPV
jgi:hypothetical protein